MTIRVHAVHDMTNLRTRVFIVDYHGPDNNRKLMQIGDTGNKWEEVPVGVEALPTFSLPTDLAIQLCDALQEAFGRDGTPERVTQQLRSDYVDERKRVDRLIGLVEELALHA